MPKRTYKRQVVKEPRGTSCNDNRCVYKCHSCGASRLINWGDKDDDDDDKGSFRGPTRRPRTRSLFRRKTITDDNKEGKNFYQENNSSSDEENATLNKTRRVINEERKENTKPACKRTEPQKEDPPLQTDPAKKHAKKVKKIKRDNTTNT